MLRLISSRPRALRLLSFVASVPLCAVGCSEQAALAPGPITADFGDLAFEVPDRPDLYQPQRVGELIAIRICNREAWEDGSAAVSLCEGLSSPVVNRYGISTLVHPPRDAAYSLLGERPSGAPPPAAPMVPILRNLVDRDFRSGGEAYELHRVDLGSMVGELQTTSRGWPIAVCKLSITGDVRQCGIGFLIEDVFVEAHWTAEPGAALDQAEVWAIAGRLDDKIRSLLVDRPGS